MRLFAPLLDMIGLRAWRERVLLGAVALVLGLLGLVFLLAACFRALAQMIGVLQTDLIFGCGFLLLALLCWGITRYRWRRRPRPAQSGALLAVLAEGLALVRSLMRRDPAVLALLAILLGTLRAMLQKSDSPSD
jgi:drug/metabolite transporter (DMT)-like permease